MNRAPVVLCKSGSRKPHALASYVCRRYILQCVSDHWCDFCVCAHQVMHVCICGLGCLGCRGAFQWIGYVVRDLVVHDTGTLRT